MLVFPSAAAKILTWNLNAYAGNHHLHGPFCIFAKVGPQRLVTADEFTSRIPQAGQIQLAPKSQRVRHAVLRAAALELVDKP